MSNQNTKKNRTRIIFAIKGLIGVGLIAYLFYKVGIKSVYESLTSADPKYLLTATGLVFLSHLFGVKRWQTISSALGIESTFRHFTMLHFLGLFCNYFLPAGIGGDVVKAYYLSKSEKQRRSSYLSVLLDRYIGLLALLIVASVVALVQFLGEVDKLTKNLSYFIWAIFLMFIVGGFVSLFFTDMLAGFLHRYGKEKLVKLLKDITTLTWGFLKDYKAVVVSGLLSAASQGFCMLAVDQLSLAVGAESDIWSIFLIVPIVFLVSVIPISPGGFGTREASMVFLLSRLYLITGMQQQDARAAATAVAMLWLAVNIFTSLPGAISYPLLSRLGSTGLSEKIS